MECVLSKRDTDNGWLEYCDLFDLSAGFMASLGLLDATNFGDGNHWNTDGLEFHSSLWFVLVAELDGPTDL